MFRVAACTMSCPSARKGSETQGGDTEGDAEEGADASEVKEAYYALYHCGWCPV